MKEKIKNSVWAKMGIITGVVLIVALGVYLAMPHYSILVKTRSLSIFPSVNDFSISPGKVKVTISQGQQSRE